MAAGRAAARSTLPCRTSPGKNSAFYPTLWPLPAVQICSRVAYGCLVGYGKLFSKLDHFIASAFHCTYFGM